MKLRGNYGGNGTIIKRKTQLKRMKKRMWKKRMMRKKCKEKLMKMINMTFKDSEKRSFSVLLI